MALFRNPGKAYFWGGGEGGLKAPAASQSDRTLPGADPILDLIRSGYRTLPIVILMKNIPFSFKTLVFNRFFGTNRSKYALLQ